MMLMDFLDVHTLKILLVIGTAFTYGWMMRYRNRLRLRWYTALFASVFHTAWGVLCVTVFAFAESGFDLQALGNMSLFGAVFFMPVYYVIFGKVFHVERWEVFDICTNCMLFTLLCARVNCLFGGCCQGLPIGAGKYRWPTRECEILFYVIMMVSIARKLKKEKGVKGEVYPFYMICYGAFRFFLEGFRQQRGISVFHIAHFWAMLSICCGGICYMILKRGNQKSNNKCKGKKCAYKRKVK